MSLTPGEQLGAYEILSRLGMGGMGEVYRARHAKLGREVAIKILPTGLAGDLERRTRFEREARTASALNHPNIVTIYDIAESDGRVYIAMELVEGATVRQLLRERPLSIDRVLDVAGQVAEGLAGAHAAGVVHRDLKPENVMVTRDGLVKILDFGLAKPIATAEKGESALPTQTELTAHGMLLGTPSYMSPEQLTRSTVGPLSDQFAFGIMLYEMLAGSRPFEATSLPSVVSAILNDPPPPLKSRRPDVPRDLERIVGRCLEKEPRKRYASTVELATALRRHADAFSRGSKGLAVGRRTMAAAAILLLAAGGIAAWHWLRDDAVRWLERDTFAEIARLSEVGALYEAWRLARELEKSIPEDPELRKMLDRITLPISIVTEPPGAEVLGREYAATDEQWIRLGETPMEGVRLPYALLEWRIAKEGFEPFEGAPFGMRPFTAFAQGFRLTPPGSTPEGMVRVPGGPYARMHFPVVELSDYWLDRYEVTNRQFHAFVDAGGYARAEYWTEPFVEGGRELPRDEAMAQLVDRTGQLSPAGWEFGAYGEGRGDYPVGGVSWYEAAAYCRSVGKRLPTLFHWSAATAQDQLSDIVRVSNFGRDGPAPVGSHPGLGDFGTYDMAGNVKEWCWNEAAEGRYILGGSWGEPTYTFRVDTDAQPPLSREPSHGFRCARFEDPPDEALLRPVTPSRHAGASEPAPEGLFAAYRSLYSYDRTALEAAVESVDESSPHWRKETVSFAAAYGGERVLAHLFLPRDVEPPYQPVVWFPGNDAFFLRAGDGLASTYLFDFIPRSGRALVYPVYKGTYERYLPFSFAPNEWRDMIVLWSKDLRRTVDYLEERPDIDTGKLAYYGFSSGALYGPIFTAVDGRFRASILLAGGLVGGLPPEADTANFAPRSRVPTLMINGENDFICPYELSQRPLFRLLGAPDDEKRHARLEGGHIPPDRLALIDEVLSWLDRHLGRMAPGAGAAGRGPRGAGVEPLLAEGADPSLRSTEGESALDLAPRRGHDDIAER